MTFLLSGLVNQTDQVYLAITGGATPSSPETMLMSQKRWGRTRCRRFLQSIQIPESKTIGSLTQRQRLELATRLTGRTTVTEDAFATSGVSLAR